MSNVVMENEMALTLKVLWSEGLTLDAQHFQQSDRYHEARLRHMAAAIHPYFWGVQRARWTIDGVGNCSLHAHSLTLIFRDGEIYQAPLSDALPSPIDLSKLSAEEQDFVFYAALPMAKEHGGNLSGNGENRDERRYAIVDEETPDLYTDGLNVNVSYMTKTVRLLSHLDVREGYDCIPVVRVRRRGDNSFEIDPAFMPPSVSVDSNPALREMLRSLLGKLTAKCESLYRLQRQPRGHVVEVTGGDAASFWMLTTAMTASASLAHIEKSAHSAPERLFESLRALAGGLMAFSRKFGISDLPAYDHENPAPGFQALNDMIRELLDTVVSSKYIPIPLNVSDAGVKYHLGRLDAALAEGGASFYLAINANMPALNLVAEVPRQLKIASPNDIDGLVRSALPGLQLVHMPQVPMEVPVRPDTYHFAIENRGELYDAMLKAQAVAIYAPSTFTDLRLELYAISN
jgi:type VI secretion system protein ImpJ